MVCVAQRDAQFGESRQQERIIRTCGDRSHEWDIPCCHVRMQSVLAARPSPRVIWSLHLAEVLNNRECDDGSA